MVFVSLIKEIFLKLGNLSAAAMVAFAMLDYDLTLPIGYSLSLNTPELAFLGEFLMWHILLVFSLICWLVWLVLHIYEWIATR